MSSWDIVNKNSKIHKIKEQTINTTAHNKTL